MLAVATTDAFAIIPPSFLRGTQAPSVLPFSSLTQRPTFLTWSPDNGALFIASSSSIQKYDASGRSPQAIYSSSEPSSSPISCVVSKDKGNTVILSTCNKIGILECGSNSGATKLARTFESHKTSVTSLSLSNDSTLLASTSSNAVHIHNLTLFSHTILKGLPPLAKITACTFSPHARTRLLLGIGKQFVVYDTTRPSGPLKMLTLPAGEIVAITCSPFSKTLVAVASAGGSVFLIDLDKDRPPRVNFSAKAPITSMVFSAEGDSIYIGTENGKLLVQSLRTLDKPPKSITISEKGLRIEGMSLQKKLRKASDATKSAAANTATTAVNAKTSTTSKPESSTRAGVESNHVKPQPGPSASSSNPELRSNAVPKPSSTSSRPIARINARAASTPSPERGRTSAKRRAPSSEDEEREDRSQEEAKRKRLFSPVRDPLGDEGAGEDAGSGESELSLKFESLAEIRKKTARGQEKGRILDRMAARNVGNARAGKNRSNTPLEQMPDTRSGQPEEAEPEHIIEEERQEEQGNREVKSVPAAPPREDIRSSISAAIARSKKTLGEQGLSASGARERMPSGPSSSSSSNLARPLTHDRTASIAKTASMSTATSTTTSSDSLPRERVANRMRRAHIVPTASTSSSVASGASRPTSGLPNVGSAGAPAPSTSTLTSRLDSTHERNESNGTERTAASSSRPTSSTSTSRSLNPFQARPESRAISVRSGSTARSTRTRTPSPSLPEPEAPMTPLPVARERDRLKRNSVNLKGSVMNGEEGEPEEPQEEEREKDAPEVVEAWLRAGKGKGEERVDARRVDFARPRENRETRNRDEQPDDDVRERERELSMQVSPRKATSAPSQVPHNHANSHSSNAHDLLHTIIRDVMYDFQNETRAQMMNLHLDLVKMGRTWKKEMREVMEEYVSEMKEMKEENRRLREENERLRRGY